MLPICTLPTHKLPLTFQTVHLIYLSEGAVNLGDKLRELRQTRGLRQIDLANRLGVQPSVISGLETGARTHVGEKMLERIAKALELTVAELNSLRQLRRPHSASAGNLIVIPPSATEAELHTIRLLAAAVGRMPSLQFLALGQYLEQWDRLEENKRMALIG